MIVTVVCDVPLRGKQRNNRCYYEFSKIFKKAGEIRSSHSCALIKAEKNDENVYTVPNIDFWYSFSKKLLLISCWFLC